MKNRFGKTVCVAGFILFLMVLWSSSAIAAHYRYTYRFQKPEIMTLPNGRHLVQMPNTRHNDEMVGAPILPIKTSRVFVPADEDVVSVNVTQSKPITVEGRYNVQFALRARPLSALGPFPPDVPAANIYQTNAFFPHGLYKQRSPQFLLGVQIAEVDLAPVQYNPVNGKLKYYEQMEVFVTTRKSVKPKKVVRYRGLNSDKIKILKIVDNKADFIAAGEADSLSDEPEDPTGEGVSDATITAAEYLVITTSTLVPNFQILTDHRSSSAGGGYTTHIQDIATINATYTGDLAEKVRKYIKDMYNSGTRFVVLGGDVDLIPTRGCYAAVGDETDYNIPSDLYFGCLDGTWNEDRDDIWGETNDGEGGGDIDWYSEVYVGRISADDPTEAGNHINKIIASETGSRPNRTLMVGEQLDTVPTWGGDRMDWVYSYMDGIPVTKLYDKDGIWPKLDLISLINNTDQQYHWINHLGHSNNTINMKMGTGDVGSLSNNDYFLVYSQGCYSGNFEYGDCFGEVITNTYSDRGAYAYIGNSRYGWYNPGPYVSGASNLMHKEFVEAVFTDNFTTLGEANQIPKATLHSGTYRWIAFETNLLGCPAHDLNPISTECAYDEDCDDGLFCNGVETCYSGDCLMGLDPCPDKTCDESDDLCVPLVCDEDGICEQGEDCINCPTDCIGGGGEGGCGNGVCELTLGEDCITCPEDCRGKQVGATKRQFCCGDSNGSGINPVGCDDPRCSEEGWLCGSTSPDLYCCGNYACEGIEDYQNCGIDCDEPDCGDGTCDSDEDQCNCPGDCGIPPSEETNCTDGIDNDCDSYTDSYDADCECGLRKDTCYEDADCCSNRCFRGACK